SGGDDAQRAAAEEEMRRNLLATVLEPSAGARCARVALANPERSRQIESILLRMAQTGQLRGRVSEEQLIELLEQARSSYTAAEEAQSKTSAKKATIVYQRRKELDDDDDF
ncbi:hypothetical protein PUNSTDRAFT_36994, partial [Punctularia strigosozonata HHB-11173 SS5]|uniref:uncharacterized protein n=1 Tax=Punctularia strigosozonata (strain HHB-11173) TaxID=741275 RepID=UPI0004416439